MLIQFQGAHLRMPVLPFFTMYFNHQSRLPVVSSSGLKTPLLMHWTQVSSFKRRGQYLPSQHHTDSWEGFIFEQNLEYRPSKPTSCWNFSASNKFLYFSNWLVLENCQIELLFKMLLYLLFKMSMFNPHFWQKFGKLDCITTQTVLLFLNSMNSTSWVFLTSAIISYNLFPECTEDFENLPIEISHYFYYFYIFYYCLKGQIP